MHVKLVNKFFEDEYDWNEYHNDSLFLTILPLITTLLSSKTWEGR